MIDSDDNSILQVSSSIFSSLKNSVHLSCWLILLFRYINMFTPRNDSIRFDFDSVFATPISNRQETEPKSIRFDSIRFLIDSKPKNSTQRKYKKLLIWSFRCVVNKYIYMHLAYAACVHAKKIFFREIYWADL